MGETLWLGAGAARASPRVALLSAISLIVAAMLPSAVVTPFAAIPDPWDRLYAPCAQQPSHAAARQPSNSWGCRTTSIANAASSWCCGVHATPLVPRWSSARFAMIARALAVPHAARPDHHCANAGLQNCCPSGLVSGQNTRSQQRQHGTDPPSNPRCISRSCLRPSDCLLALTLYVPHGQRLILHTSYR